MRITERPPNIATIATTYLIERLKDVQDAAAGNPCQGDIIRAMPAVMLQVALWIAQLTPCPGINAMRTGNRDLIEYGQLAIDTGAHVTQSLLPALSMR